MSPLLLPAMHPPPVEGRSTTASSWQGFLQDQQGLCLSLPKAKLQHLCHSSRVYGETQTAKQHVRSSRSPSVGQFTHVQKLSLSETAEPSSGKGLALRNQYPWSRRGRNLHFSHLSHQIHHVPEATFLFGAGQCLKLMPPPRRTSSPPSCTRSVPRSTAPAQRQLKWCVTKS